MMKWFNRIDFHFQYNKKALFIFSLINYEQPTYNNGEYRYPPWAHGIGWGFTAASLGCIPVFAVISIIRSDGNTFFQVIFTHIRLLYFP